MSILFKRNLYLISKCIVCALFFTFINGSPLRLLDINYQECATQQNVGYRLIQTSDDYPADWLDESMVLNLIRKGIKFMDITDYTQLGSTIKTFKKHAYPPSPSFRDEVEPIIGNLTTTYMKKNLEKFTSFQTRYYRSQYGAQSSDWLFDQISDIIKNANPDSTTNITVVKFGHKWPQNSIIARFEGYNVDSSNDVVIVGAHQDSVNMWWPSFGRAPGADDDGSGTVTILEAFRSLVASDFSPALPVEFHWYSAEEGGLLGSQDVALKYEHDKRNVIAMLQNDMTGYVGRNPEAFGIVFDHVDLDLTNFVGKLIEAYAKIPMIKTKCGYACSDHASWLKAGYPSAFAIEGELEDTNPHIHSTGDLVEYLNFEHMLEFAKLSVSFAVELSHI